MKYNGIRCVVGSRLLLAVALLAVSLLPLHAQFVKVEYRWTVMNSIGEPQKDVFLQLQGYSEKHETNEEGVIEFDASLSENYERKAQIFFKDNSEKPVKVIVLKEDNKELTLYVNSDKDILRFKQENKPVEIEGILQNEAGEPIEGAVVSILGTGNQTKSDEIGLFHISTDYNHPVFIRARGMETKTMHVDAFLRNEEEAMTVTMNSRNAEYIYNVAEEMPVYRGGMKYFVDYLKHVAPYPEEMEETGIEGVVVVQFVVEKDGSISQPKIVRRLHPELDSLALCAIENSPRWMPAKDAGHEVRCRYSMPVPFRIPRPEPVVPVTEASDRVALDSMAVDSLKIDSLAMDSLRRDSLTMAQKDSQRADSLKLVTDSLRLDSLRLDSLGRDTMKVDTVAVQKKMKKRPCGFVRFFRRLFGIKRGEEVSPDQKMLTDDGDKADADKPKRKKRRRNKAQEVETVNVSAEKEQETE